MKNLMNIFSKGSKHQGPIDDDDEHEKRIKAMKPKYKIPDHVLKHGKRVTEMSRNLKN